MIKEVSAAQPPERAHSPSGAPSFGLSSVSAPASMTIASGRSASSAQIVSARASAKTRHFMPAARHRRIIVSANRSPRSSFKEFSSYAGTANTPAQPARASRASRFSSPFSLPAESMEYHSNPAMRSFLPLRFRFHCTVSPAPRQAESAVCAHMIKLPEETGHYFACLVKSDEFPLFFLTFRPAWRII